jgi:hypothetical protein
LEVIENHWENIVEGRDALWRELEDGKKIVKLMKHLQTASCSRIANVPKGRQIVDGKAKIVSDVYCTV